MGETLDTVMSQVLRARDVDEAHVAMLVEALKRGEDSILVNIQLDHLCIAAERRLTDLRELLHVREQAELRSIHARWCPELFYT